MSKADEILVSEQVLQVPFVYSAGPVVSRFLTGLRDEGKLYGLRCPQCRKVYAPPRGVCGGCARPLQEWVEVGPGGTLENFTVLYYPEPCHPAAVPLTLGIIRLDGADTGLVHVVRAAPEALRIGMRVRAVFKEKRRGHILDLEGFLPA